eukprot:SAG31_NODE_302_length_18087_cov_97.056982_20_plen_288_part_00
MSIVFYCLFYCLLFFQGPLRWLRILHESYYLIRAPKALRVGAGGHSLPLDPKMWGLVVIDSGTLYTIVPLPLYLLLANQIIDNSKPAATVNATDLFSQGCLLVNSEYGTGNLIREFPSITLVFRDIEKTLFRLDWTADKYLFFARKNMMAHDAVTPSGRKWLCSGILGSNDKTRTVLGSVFLHGFYAAFDRDNKSVGLAPVASCGSGMEGVDDDVEDPLHTQQQVAEQALDEHKETISALIGKRRQQPLPYVRMFCMCVVGYAVWVRCHGRICLRRTVQRWFVARSR